MPNYMLLLYARDDPHRTERDRDSERWLFAVATERLSERGVLVSADSLHSVETATTVRVGIGEVNLDDGPFAATEESLVACLVVDCLDLDEAVAEATRLATARRGSIEVRPVVDPREHWDRALPARRWPQ